MLAATHWIMRLVIGGLWPALVEDLALQLPGHVHQFDGGTGKPHHMMKDQGGVLGHSHFGVLLAAHWIVIGGLWPALVEDLALQLPGHVHQFDGGTGKPHHMMKDQGGVLGHSHFGVLLAAHWIMIGVLWPALAEHLVLQLPGHVHQFDGGEQAAPHDEGKWCWATATLACCLQLIGS